MGRLHAMEGDSTMRSSRMRVTGVVAVLVFLTTIIPAQADPFGTPMLEILPHQAVQKIAVEKSAVLTCRPNVADTNLISDLQWKDPMHRTIQPTSFGGDEMFTEALPGKMSLRLYIPAVRESMAGTYYCTANYANTEPLIANVTIETFMAIKFNNAPENQYPIKGDNYKVMCEVTARPSPTVDWFRNGIQIITGDRYVLETNGLLIKDVEESDDGKYACRAIVVSTGELAERHINLEVHTRPVMEQRELEVEVKEGEATSISCKARGKPEPEYSWVKSSNQEDLAIADGFRVDTISGLLTMTKVRQEDTGSYVCRATNAAGSDEITVNIEVLVPPRIFQLKNETESVKLRSNLTCKAFGRPAPTIQFKKWGTDEIISSGLQSEGRLVLENNLNRELGESTGILFFEDIERTDDGLYECIASNKAGTAYKNGHLTVRFPPTFNATVPQGPVWSWNRRPANLTCLAESIPNATIEWRFHNLPLQESRDIKIFNAGALSYVTIVPTEQWMYDRYRCIATNVLGQASLDIELREARVPGPVLQSKLESITATSIRFSIVGPAENDGPPILAFTVQYKEDRNFDYQLGMNKTWSVNSPYVIEGLTPLTLYNFRFAASNQVGIGPFGAPQAHTTPRRSTPNPPPILRDSDSLNLLSAYADQYEVRWKIPMHNGEPIDMYDIKYCPVRKVNGEWQPTSDNECVTQEIRSFETVSYQMRSLIPDTYYKISLRAHNILGFSMPSEAYVRTVKGIFDTPMYHHDGPVLSSTAIVAVVVAGVLLLLLIVDLILYCTKRQGVIASVCGKRAKKHDDEETKLGRDEKEPLKECGDRIPVIDDSLKRNTSVEFDGKKVYTTGGNIIGKNSAV